MVSVNIFFWKILVTRVKRKIELPLSPSIGAGSRLFLQGAQGTLRRDVDAILTALVRSGVPEAARL